MRKTSVQQRFCLHDTKIRHIVRTVCIVYVFDRSDGTMTDMWVCMCVEKLEPKGVTAEDEQQSPVLHLRQKDSIQAEASPSGLGPEQRAKQEPGTGMEALGYGWRSMSIWTRTRKVGEMSIVEDEEAQHQIDRRSKVEGDYKEQ